MSCSVTLMRDAEGWKATVRAVVNGVSCRLILRELDRDTVIRRAEVALAELSGGAL